MSQQPHFYTFLLTAGSCFTVLSLWTQNPQAAERVNAYLPTGIPQTADFSRPISIQSAFTNLTGIAYCPMEMAMPEDPTFRAIGGICLAGVFTYSVFFLCFVVRLAWLRVVMRVRHLPVKWLHAAGMGVWHLLTALKDELGAWYERPEYQSHDINLHIIAPSSVAQNEEILRKTHDSHFPVDERVADSRDRTPNQRRSSAPAIPRRPLDRAYTFSPAGSNRASLVVGDSIIAIPGLSSRLSTQSWPLTTRATTPWRSHVDVSEITPPPPRRPSVETFSPAEDHSTAVQVAAESGTQIENIDEDAAV